MSAPSRFSVALALVKVALHTRSLRRNLMFILTISMMVFVFLGAFPLAGFLFRHPWIFIFYWGFSFLLVLVVILLAIYDMLRISSEGRKDLDKIRKEFDEKKRDDEGRN